MCEINPYLNVAGLAPEYIYRWAKDNYFKKLSVKDL